MILNLFFFVDSRLICVFAYQKRHIFFAGGCIVSKIDLTVNTKRISTQNAFVSLQRDVARDLQQRMDWDLLLHHEPHHPLHSIAFLCVRTQSKPDIVISMINQF